MKFLVLYCHPNPKSFCRGILDTILPHLQSNKNQLVLRDLYQMKFDPVLKVADLINVAAGNTPIDIKTEQGHVKWADVLVFVYPVWWTGLPALLKGYVDRVFLNGFAFSISPKGPVGLLTGKRALLFCTQGTPKGVYEGNGMHQAMKQTSDTGILQYCGIEVYEHVFYSGVPTADNATRMRYLENAGKIVRRYI